MTCTVGALDWLTPVAMMATALIALIGVLLSLRMQAKQFDLQRAQERATQHQDDRRRLYGELLHCFDQVLDGQLKLEVAREVKARRQDSSMDQTIEADRQLITDAQARGLALMKELYFIAPWSVLQPLTAIGSWNRDLVEQGKAGFVDAGRRDLGAAVLDDPDLWSGGKHHSARGSTRKTQGRR